MRLRASSLARSARSRSSINSASSWLVLVCCTSVTSAGGQGGRSECSPYKALIQIRPDGWWLPARRATATSSLADPILTPRVWLAVGHTDMRRGMNSLAIQVQEGLGRDPHAGDLYVFRGKRGHLIKILWHDGIGMSLYAKRLERGRFIWPSPADGTVAITPAQLAYMLH